MSPVTYILISLMISSFLLGVIFLVAWQSFGRKPYALAWSVAFFVGTIQWACNLFSKDIFPSRDLYWIVVSATSIITISFGLWGHRLRVGLNTNIKYLVAVGLAVELAIIGFTYGLPHVGLRMSLGVFLAVVYLFMMAKAILQYRKHPLAAEWGAAIVMIVFAIAELIAATAALMQGVQVQENYLQVYLVVNFIALPSAYMGMGLFVVFILASDLSFEMKTLAMTDQLTRCLNRRGFKETANRALAFAKRRKSYLSLILCDIDHFKKINDKYGHAAGDETLRHFVRRLQLNVREPDIVGRIGGEEFAILLPDSNVDTAYRIAERIRYDIETIQLKAAGHSFHLTASFGVVEIDRRNDSLEDALNKADVELYHAKENGRNQVSRLQPAMKVVNLHAL